ncbi:hypothetical protein K491DRAFT_122973 [Lophiostoma macrostomum CBS 122681]|uniref:Uncharacterized protein n=1 Tax=Lophiostoma macrostomum CBS 122681 TaxID=1314788 RepID=A0A6A6TMX2_9PLEO|nr:hypothetical protein K491DRAFT_122973 [Lophiostoma macrostomum CBS 122681]
MHTLLQSYTPTFVFAVPIPTIHHAYLYAPLYAFPQTFQKHRSHPRISAPKPHKPRTDAPPTSAAVNPITYAALFARDEIPATHFIPVLHLSPTDTLPTCHYCKRQVCQGSDSVEFCDQAVQFTQCGHVWHIKCLEPRSCGGRGRGFCPMHQLKTRDIP